MRSPILQDIAGWNPAQVAPGARLVLPLRGDGEALEQAIDAVCAHWHGQPGCTAVLDCSAPFLENVSILENLWVPLTWRRPLAVAEVARRARQHLGALAWTEADLRRLLACRPGDLPPQVLTKAVLLRAALANPDWVLIEPNWFDQAQASADALPGLMEGLLGGSRWLLLWPSFRAALPPGVLWHTIQMPADC